MIRNVVLLGIAFLSCGCAPIFAGWGSAAAQGALDELGDAGARQVAAAVAAGRDEALGPAADAELQTLMRDVGWDARQQLSDAERELQAAIRQAVAESLADALGPETEARVGALREQLVGAPLRADVDALGPRVDALVDGASPHLAAAVQAAVQASMAPLDAQVAALRAESGEEAAKWKPIAIGFAVGSGLLIVCLAFGVAVLRSHRKVIEALVRKV